MVGPIGYRPPSPQLYKLYKGPTQKPPSWSRFNCSINSWCTSQRNQTILITQKWFSWTLEWDRFCDLFDMKYICCAREKCDDDYALIIVVIINVITILLDIIYGRCDDHPYGGAPDKAWVHLCLPEGDIAADHKTIKSIPSDDPKSSNDHKSISIPMWMHRCLWRPVKRQGHSGAHIFIIHINSYKYCAWLTEWNSNMILLALKLQAQSLYLSAEIF